MDLFNKFKDLTINEKSKLFDEYFIPQEFEKKQST